MVGGDKAGGEVTEQPARLTARGARKAGVRPGQTHRTPVLYMKLHWDTTTPFCSCIFYSCDWTSLVAQRQRVRPPMQETGVRSLGQEDPLEEEITTHSSILAWEIPWTEEPRRLQSMGSQRVGHD